MLRLTERLALLNDEQQDSGRRQSIADSIVKYLNQLLNTRIGSVAISPSLGMPIVDLNTGVESPDELINYLKKQILHGEPRIVELNQMINKTSNPNILLAVIFSCLCYDQTSFKCAIELKMDNTIEVNLV